MTNEQLALLLRHMIDELYTVRDETTPDQIDSRLTALGRRWESDIEQLSGWQGNEGKEQS